MATLRIFRGPELLVEHRLRPGRTIIGRADTCDIALPGDAISRTHCIIEGNKTDWRATDRSRHGTLLNEQILTGTKPIVDGSVLSVGPFLIEVSLTASPPPATAVQNVDHDHELLIDTEDQLHVERAVLVVHLDNPETIRFPLNRPRLGVGGPNSNIHVTGLVDDHFWLRITRGRVMIEPGRGAVFLEGQRLRTITPLYADEEFQAGLIRFRVDRTIFEESPKASGFGDMVGESEKITLLFGILRRIATHNFPCLIIGESGTGKELIARGIHTHSHRADGPFVALNCGAIGESIFESELFGHEKGAFTGADRRKDGAFHEADGGTLFLDEIGELPPALQTKLLRTLETGEVRRVGSTQTTHPDVRVLSATNRDLTTEVREGRFREDLFFRLAVLTAMVPPLRDRLDDLEGLIRHICHSLHPEAHISDNAMEVLRSHAWPGNVRELKNVLTRAYVMHGTRIEADNLVFHQIGHAPETDRPTKGSLKDAERHYLNTTLARHNGNRSAAAKELGIARSTLHYKLRKFGLI